MHVHNLLGLVAQRDAQLYSDSSKTLRFSIIHRQSLLGLVEKPILSVMHSVLVLIAHCDT